MPDQALIGEVNRRMHGRNRIPARTLTPVKLAVSDAAAGEVNREYRFARRPRFLAGYAGALTPAERGSAMHKFMQFADYENARDHLEDEIARMRDNAFLTPAETESLSQQSLRKFFHGSLGKGMFQSARLLREVRFMAEFGQDKLVVALPQMDEKFPRVLQGVADAVFFEHGAAVVVDYKTDRVDSMEQLLERYRVQLELYRDILSESLDAPVKSAVLYSFALSDWIEWQA
jgi:ATP-dependent helicase/nuclease subunit A